MSGKIRSVSSRLHPPILSLVCTLILAVATTSRADTSSSSEASSLRDPLNIVFRLADHVIASTPVSFTNTSELQAAIGEDPLELHAWVYENTRHIDYSGGLKGAEGTLLARQGNSLDRSLLLATLIQHAGHEVQIAWINSPIEKVRLLLEDAISPDLLVLPTLEPQSPTKIAELTGLSLPTILENTNVRKAESDRRNRRQQTLTAAGKSLLDKVLMENNHQIISPDQSAEYNNLHYWVKVSLADGSWQHWDPLQGSALAGNAIENHQSATMSDLDPDLFHRVNVEIIVGTGVGEETQHTILSKSFNTAALEQSEGVIMFSAVPSSTADTMLAAIGDDASDFWRNELQQHEIWAPAILFPEQDPLFDKAFDLSGTILSNPPGLFNTAAVQAEKAAETLGGLTTGQTESTGGADGDGIARVVLNWTSTSPGRESNTQQRILYKRDENKSATESQQALAIAMMERHGFSIQTGAVPPAHVNYTHAQIVKRMQLPLEYLLRQAEKPDSNIAKAAEKVFARLWTAPLMPLQFASKRFGPNDNLAITTPNILVEVEKANFSNDTGLSWRRHFDVVRNPVASLLNDQNMVLQSGLNDSALEAVFRGGTSISAMSLLDGMDKASFAFLSDEAALESIEVDESVTSALRHELSKGYFLVAPRKSLAGTDDTVFAWWRLDPVDGSLIGQLYENGQVRGGETAEFTTMVWTRLQLLTTLAEFAKSVASCGLEGEGKCYVCAAGKLIFGLLEQNEGLSDIAGFGGDAYGLAC